MVEVNDDRFGSYFDVFSLEKQERAVPLFVSSINCSASVGANATWDSVRYRHRYERGIPQETLDAFTSYSWPGNVRELQNLIERAVIRSDNGVLANPLPPPAPNLVGANPIKVNLVGPDVTFEDSQRTLILRALHESGWIVGGPLGAAARLKLKRTTLISKMKKLGISRPVRQREAAGVDQNREADKPWQPAAD